MSEPKTQKFVMMSARVSGMVKVQRRRSDKARLAMKMFLAVKCTLFEKGHIISCRDRKI